MTSYDPGLSESIVEEIAVDYGAYGKEANDRIKKLLKDLTDVDKVTGTRWKEIMDIWNSDELGQPLHYDVLPDGLPQLH